MKVIDVIKDLVGTILVLGEVVGLILMIGFVGGVDRNAYTLTECFKRIAVTMGIMVVAGVILYFLIREKKRF